MPPQSVRLLEAVVEPTGATGNGAPLTVKQRLATRKSRVQAAREIGVSPKTLTYWERDGRFPMKNMRERIVHFLGHNPWEHANSK